MKSSAAENGGAPATGLYWGRILHDRFQPKRHLFTYPVFIFCMDLDEPAVWNRRLRLFGYNRFSLYALRDSDHDGGEAGIKAHVTAQLREQGYDGPVDKIFMVTQFRVLGYLFNPVTFYYVYAGGQEVAHVAEVNNTFHQRHTYVFLGGGPLYRTEKVFYVSPFLDMDLIYHFRFEPLGPRLAVFVDDLRPGPGGDAMVLKTHIMGRRVPLTDGALLKSFLKIPWMTLCVISWIHWQALKLWLKKVPLAVRPKDGMKPGWRPPTP